MNIPPIHDTHTKKKLFLPTVNLSVKNQEKKTTISRISFLMILFCLLLKQQKHSTRCISM